MSNSSTLVEAFDIIKLELRKILKILKHRVSQRSDEYKKIRQNRYREIRESQSANVRSSGN